MIGSANLMKIMGIATVVILCCGFMGISLMGAEEEEPEKGIRIVLNIYSGRPNPQWWVTEGSEFDKLVALLKGLKPEDKKLFDYKKWNRLGYSSFWVIPKNIEGLFYVAHIWHDQASVTMEKGKAAQHASGAMPIYEMLTEKAIETKKGPKEFFERYMKAKAEKQKQKK